MSMAALAGRAAALPTGSSWPAGGSKRGADKGDGKGRAAGLDSVAAPPLTSGLEVIGRRSLLAIAVRAGSLPVKVPVHSAGTLEPAVSQLLVPEISGRGMAASTVRITSMVPPPARWMTLL